MSDDYTPREMRLMEERDAALSRAERAEAERRRGTWKPLTPAEMHARADALLHDVDGLLRSLDMKSASDAIVAICEGYSPAVMLSLIVRMRTGRG